MSTLSQTMSGVEYRDARMKAQADRDGHNFEAGHELGVEETVAELVREIKSCKTDPTDTIETRSRQLIALLCGKLDFCYGEISQALAEAVGMFQDDPEPAESVRDRAA